jgi:hypothetical protein
MSTVCTVYVHYTVQCSECNVYIDDHDTCVVSWSIPIMYHDRYTSNHIQLPNIHTVYIIFSEEDISLKSDKEQCITYVGPAL